MSATFNVEAAIRAAMIAKEALAVVGGTLSPRLIELHMLDVIAQAMNLRDIARKEAAK